MQLTKLSVSSKKEKKQGDKQRRMCFTQQNKISKCSVTDENINKFPCYLTIKLLQPVQDVNLNCDIQWKRVTPNITTSTQYSQTRKDLLRFALCYELRFAVAFLFAFFPRLQFSAVSRSLKQKNILNTIEELI